MNAAPASAAVNEDGTLTFSNSPLTGLAVSDVDAGSSPIRVTLSGTNGTVTLGHPTQFGISFVAGDGTDDTTMTFEGSLAAVNAALDGTSYEPAADFYGTGALTITSNDQGATGSGGALSDSDSVVITVNPVNDQPTLNAIADETVNEDAAEQTVALGGIGSGAANESQTLTVTASSSNTALIPDPTVVYTSPNASGSLKYTPVANQHGTATITVTVTDNGGTANGGVDTQDAHLHRSRSAPSTTRPASRKGGDQTVNEDSGAQTVTPWATAISKGPANESGQTRRLHRQQRQQRAVHGPAGGQSVRDADVHVGAGRERLGDRDGQDPRRRRHRQRRRRHERGSDVHDHGHGRQRRPQLHEGRQPDGERGQRSAHGDAVGDGDLEGPGERVRSDRSTSSSATTTTRCSRPSRRSARPGR